MSEDVFYGDGGFEFEDDLVTEEKFKELLNPNLVPEGRYEAIVSGYERVQPTDNGPGGDNVTFSLVKEVDTGRVLEEPVEVSRLFRVWKNPTEGQSTAQRIDSGDRALLCSALGATPPFRVNEVLSSAVGSKVILQLQHESWNNRVFMKPRRFWPCIGG